MRIGGLNFDMTEFLFMGWFGRFRRGTLTKGCCGIVGILFTHHNHAELNSRPGKGGKGKHGNDDQAGEVENDGSLVWVFSGKALLALHSAYLGDSFLSDFDGYYAGDMQQYKRYSYTQSWTAKSEMWQPIHEHRRPMIEGCGTPRFDDEVWSCLPFARRSADFKPQWSELDELMDDCGTEYKAVEKQRQHIWRRVSDRLFERFCTAACVGDSQLETVLLDLCVLVSLARTLELVMDWLDLLA